jgi:hypothetical protein
VEQVGVKKQPKVRENFLVEGFGSGSRIFGKALRCLILSQSGKSRVFDFRARQIDLTASRESELPIVDPAASWRD